jgi:regulator of CtrA degradation
MKSSKATGNRPGGTILSFSDRFTASRQFMTLYREGMALVEETADYLDRAGRLESRQLTPPASLAYTSESIKLTARLTQLASWLLVQRAIATGEITSAEANTHRYKAGLVAQSSARPEGFSGLPDTFKRLIAASHQLYGRILRLDRLLNEGYSAAGESASPITPHIERIRHAFPAA